MNRNQILADLAMLAEELCDPHQHAEPVYDRDKHRNRRLRRVWVTVQPGLLAQLGEAMADASAAPHVAGARTVPGSRPPGSWEALATLASITTAVARRCWDLEIPLRDTVEASIRALVGKAPVLDDDQAARLLADMRSWRHQAAVMTGWQSPLYAPRVPCPVCGERTLRVNLDRKAARCINRATDADGTPTCGATWDQATIGVLADYIRAALEPAACDMPESDAHSAWISAPTVTPRQVTSGPHP